MVEFRCEVIDGSIEGLHEDCYGLKLLGVVTEVLPHHILHVVYLCYMTFPLGKGTVYTTI